MTRPRGVSEKSAKGFPGFAAWTDLKAKIHSERKSAGMPSRERTQNPDSLVATPAKPLQRGQDAL
jgi:hypothetical protein